MLWIKVRPPLAFASFRFVSSQRLLTTLNVLPVCLWLAAQPLFGQSRQYAPEREFDLKHLALDITPDFGARTIAATATLRLSPVLRPLRQAHLDAVDLRVETVESEFPVQDWHLTTNQLVVTFARPIPLDGEVSLTVRYDCQPEEGLYFRTPELGYHEGETHLFTQGETTRHRHWYPSFDAPNDRFTSEVICHVPEGMIALSNGRLVSRSPDLETGKEVFHWLQDQPHVNYLVVLVAGFFEGIQDQHNDIPLGFYVLPSEIEQAPNSFRDTPDMMAFFEQEIGVDYPWDRYDQICVNDFVAGGMENTTLTVLTDRTLFEEATENLESSEGLVAHELAHQWFGDLLTCKDWSHIWLNESFATYYETLYAGHRHGPEQMLYELYERQHSLLNRSGDTRAIVRRDYPSPDDMFNHLTYPKGSWVLHMLRAQLGAELYRECIRTYVERHRLGSVVTEDLNRVLEEQTGRSWDRFFDQWVYHGGYPELEATYAWDGTDQTARISITQKQKLSDDVLLFRLPLKVRFKAKDFTVDQPIVVDEQQEDFNISLPGKPDIVRLDPDLHTLARIRFPLPRPMIEAQLGDLDDLIGRLLACEHLAKRHDHDSVTLLRKSLQTDPFYGVRVKASQSLRSIHSAEALQALLASLEQPDARVRIQVVRDLGGFYREDAYEALVRVTENDSNPAIVAEALKGLAGYAKPETLEIIIRHLRIPSYRDRVARAALSAARKHGDPTLRAPIFDLLTQDAEALTHQTVSAALTTLAHLSREETDQADVREAILSRVEHPRQSVRVAALRALGTLGDPRALPVLERFAGAETEKRERQSAESSIRAIREKRPVSQDLQQLRKEVLELRRQYEELKKQLKQ
jgi:aminopeptidase N